MMRKGRKRYVPGLKWEDLRKPDVPYKYRYELPNPENPIRMIRDAALSLRAAISCFPLSALPRGVVSSGKPIPDNYDLLARSEKMLGVRVHPYAVSKSPESHIPTVIVHRWKDVDVYYEDYLPRRKREFCVAHELGHLILHTGKGTTPAIFPRLSGGAHDREANVFAGYFCLPDDEMSDLETQMGGSLLAMASFLSRKFHNVRYIPPGPQSSGQGNKRKGARSRLPPKRNHTHNE